VEKRNAAVRSLSGASLYHSGAFLLEFTDGFVQVIHFKTEMIDGAFLSAHDSGHGIIAPVRLGVMQEFDGDISDGQKAYLKVNSLVFFNFRTFEPEAGEFVESTVKVIHHDPDVPQFF
jgi:hypothetical protein